MKVHWRCIEGCRNIFGDNYWWRKPWVYDLISFSHFPKATDEWKYGVCVGRNSENIIPRNGGAFHLSNRMWFA